jgi:hypothetical protein
MFEMATVKVVVSYVLFICLFVSLFIYSFIYLCLFIYLSIYLFIYLFNYIVGVAGSLLKPATITTKSGNPYMAVLISWFLVQVCTMMIYLFKNLALK